MMEWWNIGKSKIPSLAGLFLKGNISLKNSLVSRNITNSPCKISWREPYLIPFSGINHYPNFPKTIIPSFHYSNIPIGAKPLSSCT
jgi:hypothetical protein